MEEVNEFEIYRKLISFLETVENKFGIVYCKEDITNIRYRGQIFLRLATAMNMFYKNRNLFYNNPYESFLEKYDERKDLDEQLIGLSIDICYICYKSYNYNQKFYYAFPTEECSMDVEFKIANQQLSDLIYKEMEKLRNKPGIYFLYNYQGGLIYIGQSKNLKKRLPESIAKHKPYHLEYFISVSDDQEILDNLEYFFIDKYKPQNNAQYCKYSVDENNYTNYILDHGGRLPLKVTDLNKSELYRSRTCQNFPPGIM